jgi:hypothetical protein
MHRRRHIAAPGTLLKDGNRSLPGHMYVVLGDGSSRTHPATALPAIRAGAGLLAGYGRIGTQGYGAGKP